MSEIGMERRVNELKNCNDEELMQILGTVDPEILLAAVWNEIKRLKKLEADMKNLFQR